MARLVEPGNTSLLGPFKIKTNCCENEGINEKMKKLESLITRVFLIKSNNLVQLIIGGR
jgi:hypothetical protein